MNWVFETYSNVYNTAMMQDVKVGSNVAAAKKSAKAKGAVARLFSRA